MVKIAFAIVLILVLFESGKIDFIALKELLTATDFWLASFLVWTVAVAMSGLRWFILLQNLCEGIRLKLILYIHSIGIFFNVVMPGSVGGDLVKVLYVCRTHPEASKVLVLMSTVVDRLIGLGGLFLFSFFVTLGSSELINSDVLFLLRSVVFGGLMFFGGLFLTPTQKIEDLKEGLNSRNSIFFQSIGRVVSALLLYRSSPKTLVLSLVASLIAQFALLIYFQWLTLKMLGTHVDLSALASVLPVGQLFASLPIAPAGIGVGHAAFEHLYKLIGLEGGANVFNAFLVGNLLLNLIGVIPYLAFGRFYKKTAESEYS